MKSMRSTNDMSSCTRRWIRGGNIFDMGQRWSEFNAGRSATDREEESHCSMGGKYILAQMPGYKVVKEEIDFHDIQISGDWASEWGNEHQVVQPPDGKPVIDSRGKMALVLHREASGEWKVKQEMWNQVPKQ